MGDFSWIMKFDSESFSSALENPTVDFITIFLLCLQVPGGKELLAFLFNDFLLFSTIKSSSSNWQTQIFEAKSNLHLKLYRVPILLMDIIIANDVLNDQLSFSITMKTYEKPLVLKTHQTNVR